MRLLFIRHGDPDYVNDRLTEKGKREARQLAACAPDLDMGSCYVSPLGRARETAALTLENLKCQADILDWLEEFPARINLNEAVEFQSVYPNTEKKDGKYVPRIVWDMLPSYWARHPELFDPAAWRTSPICRCSDTLHIYDYVTGQFEQFLADHGYVREGLLFRVKKESFETITFFCHFGITCVFLSWLWNVSPFLLWHTLALAPTSVTEIVTEEREKGTACFRGLKLGDVSHLYAGKEPVSFSARFCEVYSNSDRH